MKKVRSFSLLCLTFILVLALGLLAGCGPTTDPASSNSSSSSTADTTASNSNTTEPTSSPTQPATDPTETPETDPPATNPTDAPETTEPPATNPTAPPSDKGAAIAATAKALEGTPFEMGATGPDKFDNSGLVYYCMKQNGINVPRLTRDMYKAGTAVEKENLQPGDAVFFYMDTEGAVQYVGIYLGDNQFIASNNPDSPTTIYSINTPYFTQRYLGARRY